MTDPISSALLGGLARLAPEVLGFFDKRNARKHELAMNEFQLKLVALQSTNKLAEVSANADAAHDAAALQALVESIKAQATPSGIKWVDALSAAVRPIWTYLVLLAWASTKSINIAVAYVNHMDWSAIQPMVWGNDDAGMLAMLSTFWFLDRVLTKKGK